jgi:putative membrane protein
MNDPRQPGVEDGAERRTRLANERTYLAWWRTGMTAFAVSLGAGRLIPALTKAQKVPSILLGVGFGLLGVAFVAYGLRRESAVSRAIDRGEYARPEDRVLIVLTMVGLLLGLGVVADVLASA